MKKKLFFVSVVVHFIAITSLDVACFVLSFTLYQFRLQRSISHLYWLLDCALRSQGLSRNKGADWFGHQLCKSGFQNLWLCLESAQTKFFDKNAIFEVLWLKEALLHHKGTFCSSQHFQHFPTTCCKLHLTSFMEWLKF